MESHQRYVHQATWTRELRTYLLARAGFDQARRVLEVGAGTGAILAELAGGLPPSGSGERMTHGLDISFTALNQARVHAPTAILCQADAHFLPYENAAFDIVCCHFLLLWVSDQTQVVREMRRVTRPGGFVASFAEPDYAARVDLPSPLTILGQLQTQSLQSRGANTSIGGELAALFRDAGLQIVESGTTSPPSSNAEDRVSATSEREILQDDLRGLIQPAELERLMQLDLDARRRGERVLHVPTYFALAQV